MEIIEVPGYSPEDKVPIASNHIIPKQLELHGLTDQSMVITDDIVKLLGMPPYLWNGPENSFGSWVLS